MADLELKIKTIKSESERDIGTFIDNMASELANIDGLENDLETFFEKKGLQVNEKKQKLFALILLSCVLGDIGTQMSPYVRNQNIAKIKDIANKININYNYLVSFTSYSDDFMGIINSYLVRK